ncbi:hypothetical protein ACFFLM_05655 [Deinococcus oregonensis]|uniref:Uncharacterized protein n=1 Tax=Deinococcus oregonensis TaxID=1805970 RepID=A0ABV6AVB9_9DEIO
MQPAGQGLDPVAGSPLALIWSVQAALGAGQAQTGSGGAHEFW